jgi:hypothetical protein
MTLFKKSSPAMLWESKVILLSLTRAQLDYPTHLRKGGGVVLVGGVEEVEAMIALVWFKVDV